MLPTAARNVVFSFLHKPGEHDLRMASRLKPISDAMTSFWSTCDMTEDRPERLCLHVCMYRYKYKEARFDANGRQLVSWRRRFKKKRYQNGVYVYVY